MPTAEPIFGGVYASDSPRDSAVGANLGRFRHIPDVQLDQLLRIDSPPGNAYTNVGVRLARSNP